MDVALFYILAASLIAFSILTVTARNPVRSAVYLISALLSMAGLFFLMKAEFVGAVQILVYVGGVMVLFLFVILLVNVRVSETEKRTSRNWKTAVVLGVVLAAEIVYFLVGGTGFFETAPVARVTTAAGNTESVGAMLYSTYLLPFEIASVLLLVAIVGAVVLAKRNL